ncbi:MAG: zinc ribbon domain-containing protein [Solirubrobacteraceae bacterium]
MADTIFCHACGEPIPADSNYCEHCGVRLERVVPSRKSVVSTIVSHAQERVQVPAPGTAELASQISVQLRAPTVTLALTAGALAAAGMFAIGVVLNLALPDHTLVGAVGEGKGVISAGFAQMVNFLQTGYGDGVGRVGPALFVVFPIGTCAFAAVAQARRTLGLAPSSRLLSGAGVGLVFGLLMLIPALGAGSLGGVHGGSEPNALAAVFLGALWGALGGLLGTYYIVRTALTPGFIPGLIPPTMRASLGTAYLALRPLAVLLAVMTVASTGVWTVETLLKADLRRGNSTPVATVDNAAYAIEHGLDWAELAGLAQFESTGGTAGSAETPVPIGDLSKLKVNGEGRYRLFGFIHVLPAYTFIPLVTFLLGSGLALAFAAGAAVAQSRLPATLSSAAAWGSLVGPAWALAMVILDALFSKALFGRADGSSVFWSFLLAGLGVGALGGLVSMQGQHRRGSNDVEVKAAVDAVAATNDLGGQ